jgi:hypothetical protein
MKRASEDLAKQLAELAAERDKRRERDRQEVIADEFGLTEPESLPSWVPGLRRWRRNGERMPPLPTAKETGKRYCRRCGCHKKLASFDAVDGKLSDACRACEGGPKAIRSAA